MVHKILLDFCRVKKIFDKGFGFLSSLYFDEPVFFHFNKIKDPAVKEKLNNLKRGEVYFYYTSTLKNNKRKAEKLWLDIKDVDKSLLPDFIDRIILELNGGNVNIFEIAHVIKQLVVNNFLSDNKFREILVAKKMLKTPSLLKAIIDNKEQKINKQIDMLIDELNSKKISQNEWADTIMQNKLL